MAMSYAVWLTRTSLPGEIEARDDVVVVRRGNGYSVVKKRNIVSAYVTHRTVDGIDYPTVEIETRRGSVLSARMRELEPAKQLVEALGFGPGGKRVRIALARPTRRLLNPFIGGFAYALGGLLTSLVVAGISSVVPERISGTTFATILFAVATFCITLVYDVLKRLFAAPVVEIGNDGVAVKRGFKTTRVPKSAINTVSHRSFGMPVVIERKNGKDIGINAVLVDEARKQAVAQVAEDRLFRNANPPDRAASFDRAGRSVSEWKMQLRSALDGGYRAAGTSVDDAAAVLASPGATSDQRIGAAIALRVAGEGVERVRIAAEGAVDPRLRVALEAIAEDESDERVEKKLRRLG
jgi:hypothetical protein